MTPSSLVIAKNWPSVGLLITMLLTLLGAFVNVVHEQLGFITVLATNKMCSINISLVFASQHLPSVTRNPSGIKLEMPFGRSLLRWVDVMVLFGLHLHARYAEQGMQERDRRMLLILFKLTHGNSSVSSSLLATFLLFRFVTLTLEPSSPLSFVAVCMSFSCFLLL